MIPEILVVIVWAYSFGRFLLMKRDPNAAGVSSTGISYTNCLYLERVCEVKRWEINDCGGKTEKKNFLQFTLIVTFRLQGFGPKELLTV